MIKFLFTASALVLLMLAGGARPLAAQDASTAPPKVLVIDREMVKPGKDAGHVKNEAAFAQGLAANKIPGNYIAATTMSGPNEAWFLVGFDSYADWEKSNKASDNPKVLATLGPLMEKDGDYISESRQVVASYNEKWSYRPTVDIVHTHYFEVETIRVRAGHARDFDELIAMSNAASEKINLDEHDIAFGADYGNNGNTIYIFTPRKSLADIDAEQATVQAFRDAIGEEGRKRRAQLAEAAIASDTSDLIQVSPEMSYPADSWIKGDPTFWKPKTAKPAAKAAAPPAAEKKAAPPSGN